MTINIRKHFQIIVMTYGSVILDFVTKQFDFCPIHLDNVLLYGKLKCVLEMTSFSLCAYKTGKNKTMSFIFKVSFF